MPEFVAPSFVKIRTGLLDKKHVQKMGGGSPLVLYLYLQARVQFRGEGAGVTAEPYTHEQAAEDLGLKVNSVKVWFQQLRKEGYITTRQLRHGLEVTITKYGGEPLKGDTQLSPSEPRVIPTHPKGDTHTTKGDMDTSPSYKDARATRDSRDSENLSPPTPPAPRPAPKPNKSAELIDTLKALDVPLAMAPRDHQALKATALSVSQVAEAYCAAYRGEWGDTWLQDNLSVHVVINRWAGYMAAKTQPAPRRRTNGRPESALEGIAAEMGHLMAQESRRDEHRNGHLAAEAGAAGPPHLLAGTGQAHRQLPHPHGRAG